MLVLTMCDVLFAEPVSRGQHICVAHVQGAVRPDWFAVAPCAALTSGPKCTSIRECDTNVRFLIMSGLRVLMVLDTTTAVPLPGSFTLA